MSASGDDDKPKGETPIRPPRGRRRAIERIVGPCVWMDCSSCCCCCCCCCCVEGREGTGVARARRSDFGFPAKCVSNRDAASYRSERNESHDDDVRVEDGDAWKAREGVAALDWSARVRSAARTKRRARREARRKARGDVRSVAGFSGRRFRTVSALEARVVVTARAPDLRATRASVGRRTATRELVVARDMLEWGCGEGMQSCGCAREVRRGEPGRCFRFSTEFRQKKISERRAGSRKPNGGVSPPARRDEMPSLRGVLSTRRTKSTRAW